MLIWLIRLWGTLQPYLGAGQQGTAPPAPPGAARCKHKRRPALSRALDAQRGALARRRRADETGGHRAFSKTGIGVALAVGDVEPPRLGAGGRTGGIPLHREVCPRGRIGPDAHQRDAVGSACEATVLRGLRLEKGSWKIICMPARSGRIFD